MPKCENSATEAANIVATPASTAFPPWIVHPHAGLVGVFAARSESASSAASGVHGGKFEIFVLRGSRTDTKKSDQREGQLVAS